MSIAYDCKWKGRVAHPYKGSTTHQTEELIDGKYPFDLNWHHLHVWLPQHITIAEVDKALTTFKQSSPYWDTWTYDFLPTLID